MRIIRKCFRTVEDKNFSGRTEMNRALSGGGCPVEEPYRCGEAANWWQAISIFKSKTDFSLLFLIGKAVTLVKGSEIP